MGALGSTLAAMHVAISGIVDAERMHERAAVDVQRSFHGPDSSTPLQSSPLRSSPQRPPDEGAQGRATTLQLSSGARQVADGAPDLASAMTTMMKAETYNEANVAVLKTADEMTQELVRIVG